MLSLQEDIGVLNFKLNLLQDRIEVIETKISKYECDNDTCQKQGKSDTHHLETSSPMSIRSLTPKSSPESLSPSPLPPSIFKSDDCATATVAKSDPKYKAENIGMSYPPPSFFPTMPYGYYPHCYPQWPHDTQVAAAHNQSQFPIVKNCQETVDYSPTHLLSVRARSRSRGNFAVLLMKEAYSESERLRCNVKGVKNKEALSPKRLNKIKDATLSSYPVSQKETKDDALSECVKAIDSCNRSFRLARK